MMIHTRKKGVCRGDWRFPSFATRGSRRQSNSKINTDKVVQQQWWQHLVNTTFAIQFSSQIWLEWHKRRCSTQVSDKLNLWTKVASYLQKIPSKSLVAWLGFFVCRLLKDKMLPPGNTLRGSHRYANFFLTIVGLSCEFIHSCKNDFVLFRGKAEKLVHCPKCGESWYRQDLQGTNTPQKVNIDYPGIKACNLMSI
jgi:hypothetical protein